MEEKNTIKDLAQAIGSAWLVILGLVFISYPERFVDFLILSIIAWCLLLALYAIVRKRKFGYIFKRAHSKDTLSRLRRMNRGEFEDFIANLYSKLGYHTQRVSGSEVGGIDIFVSGKEGDFYLVCSNQANPEISQNEVADFYEALLRHRTRGIFVATNFFSPAAEKLAEEKEIELVDAKRLVEMIDKTGNKF